MASKIKIAVCVPMYGGVMATWVKHFMEFCTVNSEKYVLDIILHIDQPVDKTRNKLVELALERNPDYIFWMDSDNIVPLNAIDKFIDVMRDHKADLVSGLYYQKAPPYYPVLRRYSSGGFWNIDTVEHGKIIEIGGCGFGCCMLKPEVFKIIPGPWFTFSNEKWGQKDIQLSEDLYFCRSMLKKGMKLVCHTGIISPHLGGSVDVMEASVFRKIRSDMQEERELCMQHLVEFTGLTREEVDMNVIVGPQLIKEEWNEWANAGEMTDERVKNFYSQTKNYLYDLSLWHFSNRRQFDIELVTSVKRQVEKDADKFKDRKPRILDYGCGIGQNGLMLAREGFDVTLADIECPAFQFAKFRAEKEGLDVDFWELCDDSKNPEKFDFIFCFDVLEHLSEKTMEEAISRLEQVKDKETKILLSTTFGKSKSHPRHYDQTARHKELMERLLNGGDQ